MKHEKENQIINYGNIDNTSGKYSRTYCVYCHVAPNGKMYIGQTCKTLKKRANSNGSGYKFCTFFYNAIQKYGWDNFQHIILIDGLSKAMADIVEMALIKKYDLTNCNNGYNLAEGGYTYESKSETVYQYDLDGNYMASYYSIHDAMMKTGATDISKCVRGIVHSSGGYLWSYEMHDHIDSYLDRSKRNKMFVRNERVYQFDLSGNFIASYKSASEAKRVIGVQDDKIRQCIYGHGASCGGYQWTNYYADYIEPYKIKTTSKAIYQYGLNGMFIAKYDSAYDAACSIGVCKDTVSKACRSEGKYCHGYFVSYTELDDDILNNLINKLVKENKDMVNFKDVEKKVSQGKRNIKITGVSIVDDQLVDESGSIVDRLAEVIPSGVTNFDLKISIILDDEESDEDNSPF